MTDERDEPEPGPDAAPTPTIEVAAPEAYPGPGDGADPLVPADPEVRFVMPATAYEEVVAGATGGPPPGGVHGHLHPAFGDPSEAVRALGDRIDRRLDELQTLFDREIRAEATREKVVDRLHAELQDYKQDLLLNTLRPVFVDLIQLHDDIGKVAVDPPDAASDEPDPHAEARRLVGLMRGFQQGIEDVLYRQGVEPFRAEGDAFDPRRQRAVSTVPADDPSLNKTVAARLRKGFRSGDRVIRPEVVSVYATKKPG